MKILIATNHSYMFYRFRKELVEALMQEHEVILSTPFVGHEDDLQAMGLRCIETDIDRRSINPFKDMKLLKTYRQMLDELQPDMVVTYSIKPNIYMGTACKAKGIPYVANVQGLGTAFEKPVLSSVVSVMYRSALRKAKRCSSRMRRTPSFPEQKDHLPPAGKCASRCGHQSGRVSLRSHGG